MAKMPFQKKDKIFITINLTRKYAKKFGESFFIIKSGFNEEEKCDKCKRKIKESENFSHKRFRDFQKKINNFDFSKIISGVFCKNLICPELSGAKNVRNSTYIKQHIRMNSPKLKFDFSPKYRAYKGKEKFDDNYIGKNNKYAGHREYNDKKKDDFEVDLDS